MRGGIDALDLLKCVCEADEAWRVPYAPQVPERESTVVEAAAGTEPHAPAVERYQGQEHHIEPPGAKRFVAVRLGDTEAVVAPALLPGQETHGAGLAAAIDTGQKYLAAAPLGELDQRRGIELPAQRCVERDARATLQVQGLIGIERHAARSLRPLLRRHLPTLRIEARPQCSAGGLQRV